MKLLLAIPEGRLLYDLVYDASRGKWIPWMDTIDVVPVSLEAEYTSIIVPTADTVRYTYLLDKLVTHGSHCLFVGPTGALPLACYAGARQTHLAASWLIMLLPVVLLVSNTVTLLALPGVCHKCCATAGN